MQIQAHAKPCWAFDKKKLFLSQEFSLLAICKARSNCDQTPTTTGASADVFALLVRRVQFLVHPMLEVMLLDVALYSRY